MVASQHEEVLRVFDLVGQHEADGLDGLFAPVHIVAQKQIVRFSRESCVLEQLYQV